MKVERKRIFISDLPETATQDEVKSIFSEYGNVVSVEVKERKELGPKNKSLFFAYINIDIDDKTLQKCFQDFSSETWHGQYVQLQVARESFLERLKREREESGHVSSPQKVNDSKVEKEILVNGDRKGEAKKYSIENRSSQLKSISNKDLQNKLDKVEKKKEETSSSDDSSESSTEDPKGLEEKIDIVIKNNKGKSINKNGLKIASIGKEPILKIDRSKKKDVINTSESNLKRLQSLQDMKKGYQTQKSLIKAALSNVDAVKSNKIVFNDETDPPPSKKKKLNSESNKKPNNTLFNDEDSDDEFKGNFEVKEHFQGKKGQQLLELQSRFKNDKRFALNEKFLDDEKPVQEETEEISLQAEKRKEYEILEQVIGKKFSPKFINKESIENQEQNKAMLRFDPSRPEHSEFERPVEQVKKKERKKKSKDAEVDISMEKKREDPEEPDVSKNVFYKVTDDLKNNLHKKEEFSLLNMFGDVAEMKDDEPTPKQLQKINKNVKNPEKNPFKYDSSGDEDDDDIPHTGEEVTSNQQVEKVNTTRGTFWSEPFFFKDNDYRLQEGFEFLEKMKSEQKEFVQIRRDLKGIVRAKVRNNERKNKMFKKKLGGSKNKKRKHIRIKKALHR